MADEKKSGNEIGELVLVSARNLFNVVRHIQAGGQERTEEFLRQCEERKLKVVIGREDRAFVLSFLNQGGGQGDNSLAVTASARGGQAAGAGGPVCI